MTTTPGQMEVFIDALTEEETYKLLVMVWNHCTDENQGQFLDHIESER